MSRIDRLVTTTRRAQAPTDQLSREDLLPNSVGNAAYLRLGNTVTAAILGLEIEGAAVERHRQWLEDSADREERFGDPPSYFAMLHREGLGLATWMVTGRAAEQIFLDAARLHEQALNELSASASTSPDEVVSDYLPDLVRDLFSSGRYDRGLATYTRHLGRLPDHADGVETPLQLAAWLCRELGRFNPPASWLSVGGRVLRPLLLDWLERGQGVRAALWLKLVYGDSGAARTPRDALCRGGELLGALPVDPLTQLMLDSFGDPVDVDLFGGFLATVGAAALPAGATIVAEFTDAPALVVPVGAAESTSGLDRAVAIALAAERPGTLTHRLTEAIRGRVVDVDGETPLTVHEIRIS